ncbi:TrbI/VirB10 family protein [Primorskyibacter flagellatus]|uniref:Type IV secretion system protein VirB10 n=1 Tax=Primorskyibacter flagellatus TaxID=1387277 RepID=A0A1W2DX67_9RHOB|nr:TrbI/VirB10 family protein [Primorskyibacter flagellatus]SMD02023.1 type IV secretion system protein VirB10 [Primorskyibacter flagellatus]
MAGEQDENLRERLNAIGGQANKARNRGKTGKLVLASAAAAALVGGGFYISTLLPDETRETTIPVGSVDEFPDDDAGFGNVVVPVAQPVPAPVQPDNRSDELLKSLQAQIETLNAEQAAKLAQSQQEREAEIEALRSAMEADLGSLREVYETAQKDAQDREAKLLEDLRNAATEAERRELQFQSDMQQKLELERQRAQLRIDELTAELNRANSAPPAPATDPDELLRLQREKERREQLEAARALAEEQRLRRINSGMIAFSGQGAEAGSDNGNEYELSADEAFVQRQIKAVPVSTSQRIARPDITIIQGTIIQAALETAIDSSLPGVVRAVVSEDVHSFDGSNILVPRGSKIFGDYRSTLSLNQSRVLIVWTRIVTPEGRSAQIASYGADALGRSGSTGHVDKHFMTRFGSAAAISLIGAIPGAVAAQTGDETTSDMLEQVSDDLASNSESAIEDYLTIPPTVYIHQGSQVSVFLDRDLQLP